LHNFQKNWGVPQQFFDRFGIGGKGIGKIMISFEEHLSSVHFQILLTGTISAPDLFMIILGVQYFIIIEIRGSDQEAL
jgi:hypothetical protein